MTRASSGRTASALAHLPEVDRALASLALWCDIRDGDGTHTRVSGDVIYVGRDFERLALHEQIGLIGRHVLHVALRHEVTLQSMTLRLGADADADLFNLLATAWVNDCLLAGGHALPRPAMRLSDILDIALPEEKASLTAGGDMLMPERLFNELTADPPAIERLHEYARTKGFTPEIFPATPDTARAREKTDWRAHLIRARHMGGGAGRGIGQVLQNLKGIMPSQTPWEARLRGLMAKALNPVPQISFRRPRAQWIARDAQALRDGRDHPAFEPAIIRTGLIPRIVVGIDSSGSVSAAVLRLFAGEVIAISRKTGAETHVLCFDETVFDARRVAPEAPFAAFADLAFLRDGGTSFADVIAHAEAMDPSLIVILSDLAGAFGPPPRARVIWASPTRIRRAPPFGTVLELCV